MPRIKEVSQLVRRRYAQAKGIVALELNRGLAAMGLAGPQKAAAGRNRTEITQAAFPDKLSDVRRPTPGR